MSTTPELVHWMLGDNGDEKFPPMATLALLDSTDPPIRAEGLAPVLGSLARFIPEDDMDQDDLARIEHSQAAVRTWCYFASDLLEGRAVIAARAAAILWTTDIYLVKELAQSSEVMDRALCALADLPKVDAQQLWSDPDPLVRSAFICGHGTSCPTWDQEAGLEDLDPSVAKCAEVGLTALRYEEPGSEYRCQCNLRAEWENTLSSHSGEDFPNDLVAHERLFSLDIVLSQLHGFFALAEQNDLASRLQIANAAGVAIWKIVDGDPRGASAAFANHTFARRVHDLAVALQNLDFDEDEARQIDSLVWMMLRVYRDSLVPWGKPQLCQEWAEAIAELGQLSSAIHETIDAEVRLLHANVRERDWMRHGFGKRQA